MKVLIIYYSMYGNIYEMAKYVAEGARSIQGAEVSIKQVHELIPQEVIDSNPRIKEAKEKQKDIPYAEVQELSDYDAIIWGSPTRYGNATSQMRNFIDQTGSLWTKGKLENKVTGVFTSTSSIHGGQESTILTSMVPLLHLGMIIIGVPYSVPELLSTESGGTPYGPSHVAGAKSDQAVTEDEKKIAIAFGRRIAETAAKMSHTC